MWKCCVLIKWFKTLGAFSMCKFKFWSSEAQCVLYYRSWSSICPAWRISVKAAWSLRIFLWCSYWTTFTMSLHWLTFSTACSTARASTGEKHTCIVCVCISDVENADSHFHAYLIVLFSHSPYIIGTMNQTPSPTPNLQLHHNFRYHLIQISMRWFVSIIR